MTVTESIAVARSRGSSAGRVTLGPLLLVLPALAIIAGVFVYPLFEIFMRSFSSPNGSLDNYAWFVSEQSNWAILWNTVSTAGLATIACLVLGYPYAYLMTQVSPKARNFLFIVALLPFWISIMIRTFAWMLLLQDTGIINTLLEVVGAEPLHLLRTQTGVLIGTIQILLPFMILPLYSSMQAIDLRLITAAESLGAKRITALFRIFVPLTLPGVAAGSLLVFVQTLGFYVTPALLGSPQNGLMSQHIYAQVSGLLQWGRGSVMAVMLLATTIVILIVMGLLSKLSNKKMGG